MQPIKIPNHQMRLNTDSEYFPKSNHEAKGLLSLAPIRTNSVPKPTTKRTDAAGAIELHQIFTDLDTIPPQLPYTVTASKFEPLRKTKSTINPATEYELYLEPDVKDKNEEKRIDDSDRQGIAVSEAQIPIQNSENMKPKSAKRRILNAILYLFVVFFYLAILSLLIRLLVLELHHKDLSLSATSGAFQYIANNLQEDPILSITTTSGSCPADYETNTLNNWPGVPEGCYCYDDGNLEPINCAHIGHLSCKSVYSVYNQELFSWKNLQWCLKRAQKSQDYVVAETCPTGYKQCSPNICVTTETLCPITNLAFTPTPVSSEYIQYGTGFLNIYRDNNVVPLVDVSVNVAGLPCFSLNEYPDLGQPFELVIANANGCRVYGFDQSSFAVDNEPELDFVKSNNVQNLLLNSLAFTNSISSKSAFLVARKRLEVASTPFCSTLDISRIEKASDADGSLNSHLVAETAIAVVLHTVVGLVLLAFFSGRLAIRKTVSQQVGKEKSCYKTFFLSCLALEAIVLMIMVIFVGIYHTKIISTREYFDAITSNNCFGQSQAGQVIEGYSNFIKTVVSPILTYTIAVFILSFAYFLFMIVAFIISSKI